jgi:hypothetical protein
MWRFLLSVLALSGCAELKTRYAGDPWLSCGRTIEVREFCTNFDSSAALGKDPDVQRARIHCRDFYGEAIRATKLLCSYFEEMDSLAEWGEGDDSPMLTAKGKRIHRRYSELAQLRSRELERAYGTVGGRGVRGAIEELAYGGREALRAELECRPRDSRAPGLLLLGLSAQQRHDERVTYERLHDALRLLAGATTLELPRPFLALRETLSIEHGEDGALRSVDKLVATRLDEAALLALGKREVPSTPELERYYAEAARKAQVGKTATAQLREVSSGRGLASVSCREGARSP